MKIERDEYLKKLIDSQNDFARMADEGIARYKAWLKSIGMPF